MDKELQQYATIDCKKIKKAKTVSLKLMDEKDEKTMFERQPIPQRSGALQQSKSQYGNSGFRYLANSKGIIEKEKSFDEIMNETRKVLEMKKKLEEDEKKRLSEKQERKEKRKGKRQQKQDKKARKNKKSQQKQKPLEEEIVLTPLDMEKFETEATSIKKIIEKIKFLQTLSEKCDVLGPILSRIEQGNDQEMSLQQSVQIGRVFKDPIFMDKLQTLQLEIQLMKENLKPDKEVKQIMTPFEIQQFAEWQVTSRGMSSIESHAKNRQLVQKYTDSQNLEIYAQELEIQLKHIQDTFFSLF